MPLGFSKNLIIVLAVLFGERVNCHETWKALVKALTASKKVCIMAAFTEEKVRLNKRWFADRPCALFALLIMVPTVLFPVGSTSANSFNGQHDCSAIRASAHQELPSIDSNYKAPTLLSKFEREFRSFRVDDKDADTLSPSDLIGLSGHRPGKLHKKEGYFLAFLLFVPFLFEKSTQPRAPPVYLA